MRQFFLLALKTLAVGIVLGVACGLGVFVRDLCEKSSRLEAYESVRLGMDRSQTVGVLQKAEIGCGLVEIPDSGGNSCHFSDFWREYLIVTDPKTHRVILKRFGFKRQKTLLHR